MGYMKWNNTMSVDNFTIDNQHKELFRHIDDFYQGIMNKANKQAMSKVIGDLEAYVVKHFSTEEAMMLTAGYPNYEIHKAEHEKFITTVGDFRKRHDEGRLLLSLEVSGFIKNWITDHIMKTDQQYKGKI